jgi:hypothetical protein
VISGGSSFWKTRDTKNAGKYIRHCMWNGSVHLPLPGHNTSQYISLACAWHQSIGFRNKKHDLNVLNVSYKHFPLRSVPYGAKWLDLLGMSTTSTCSKIK